MGLGHAALDGGLEWERSSFLLVERGPQLLKPSEGERAYHSLKLEGWAGPWSHQEPSESGPAKPMEGFDRVLSS